MTKAGKATVLARVHDVVRLLLAGAEFADIRQFASEHGWQVSDRQVRRYLEAAYKRLARTTKRDRDQLLGRHLMQRRAIYARSLKGNDLRTALQVLRDEAALQGLYPSNPDGKHPSPGPNGSPLTRRERLVRLLVAEARDDKAERRLVEKITPFRIHRLPDTMLPRQLLYTMALLYVSEQLEHAAMFVNALFCAAVDGESGAVWDVVAQMTAYRFRIGQEAWLQFSEKLGIDGDYLVQQAHQGYFLQTYGEKICQLAPSAEELQAAASEAGHPIEDLTTADDLAKSWWRVFAPVCGD